MSEELLTTGQMVDRLNVGDVAEFTECVGLEFNNRKVIKNHNGIVWLDDGSSLQIDNFVANVKWRITPHYVSFLEAMDAHRHKKKTVVYHHDEGLKYVFKYGLETGQFDQLANDNICLFELLEGNWSVIE